MRWLHDSQREQRRRYLEDQEQREQLRREIDEARPRTDELFRESVAAGSIEDMEKYVDGSYGVDAADEHGYTPLILACQHGRLEAVRWLLERGADPNARTVEYRYWHECTRREREAIDINALYDPTPVPRGQTPYAYWVTEPSRTALDVALDKRNEDIVLLLMNHGAVRTSLGFGR